MSVLTFQRKQRALGDIHFCFLSQLAYNSEILSKFANCNKLIKKRTMETPFYYYILCILVAVIAFLVVKKITSCMIKVVIAIVVLAVLALIYFKYIA